MTIPVTPDVELPAARREPVPARRPWRRTGRQLLEAAFAGALLVASAPVWALVWLEARLHRRGCLVHEARVGRTRRRQHRRTAMSSITIDRRSIERRTQDLLGAPLMCARFVTDTGPVARWVGAHGLQTLPLLLNVIRCEMALVGPRPEQPDYVMRWLGALPGYERRFLVLPGLTGLAQVSGYSDSEPRGIARRAQYDLYYVDHRSWLLDVRTLARAAALLSRARTSGAPRSLRLDAPAVSAPISEDGTGGGTPAALSAGAPHVKGVTR